MLETALVVRLVAKAGKDEEVGAFLAGVQPLAVGESFTPVWFALRTEPNTFYIIDAFASDEDRTKRLTGEIAKALMGKASELLAEPPSIAKADVLGAKVRADATLRGRRDVSVRVEQKTAKAPLDALKPDPGHFRSNPTRVTFAQTRPGSLSLKPDPGHFCEK